MLVFKAKMHNLARKRKLMNDVSMFGFECAQDQAIVRRKGEDVGDAVSQ